MLNLSVIILAYNEVLHIERCLTKLLSLYGAQGTLPVGRVFVVDCFSNDGTVEIAQRLGATVIQHKWPKLYAEQFNWALDNLPIETSWVLRLDADEYLEDEAVEELQQRLPVLPSDVTALTMPCRRVWMERVIRRGTGAVILTRLFRFGKARCESRLMDEHIQTSEGQTLALEHGFFDHNLNTLDWWTQKHVGYALREALDLLNIQYGLLAQAGVQHGLNASAERKRALKLKYAKSPLFFRSALYFFVRYIVRLGFLEGKEGFCWHFFQGWWYRSLVDARILEILRGSGVTRATPIDEARQKLQTHLLEVYHLDCTQQNPFQPKA